MVQLSSPDINLIEISVHVTGDYHNKRLTSLNIREMEVQRSTDLHGYRCRWFQGDYGKFWFGWTRSDADIVFQVEVSYIAARSHDTGEISGR